MKSERYIRAEDCCVAAPSMGAQAAIPHDLLREIYDYSRCSVLGSAEARHGPGDILIRRERRYVEMP